MRFYNNIIRPTTNLIPDKEKRKGILIVILMMFNALLDFFSLTSFLPLIFLIVNPKSAFDNQYLNSVYHAFRFTSQSSFILAITVFIFVFILIKSLISIGIAGIKARYAYSIGNDIASRAMTDYLDMDYKNFSQIDFTHELNRIANYPITFANNIVSPLMNLVSEFLMCALIVVGVTWYDQNVIALLLVVLLPAYFLYQFQKRNLKDINKSIKEKYPLLLKYALQVVEGFPEIKMYSREVFFQQRFRVTGKSINETFVKDNVILSAATRLMEIMMAIVICSLVIYSILTNQNYQSTLLLLGIYAAAGVRIIPSINRILHALQQISTHEYLFEGLNALANKNDIIYKSESLNQTFNDSIEITNINFSFPGKPPLLKDVCCSIKKGQIVGLTGNSGEGKTTLLLILLRFLKQSSGQITVDGNSIKNENDWRKLIGYVPQNPYLLDGTITENIAFGIPEVDVDNQKISSIIKDLGLAEMIEQLPLGMNAILGEHGIKISGGQRQRIAIARALYADTEILFLDEITNQLHASMESEIMDLLQQLSLKKKTVIIITHKPPRNLFFDTLYVLENGILKELQTAVS